MASFITGIAEDGCEYCPLEREAGVVSSVNWKRYDHPMATYHLKLLERSAKDQPCF